MPPYVLGIDVGGSHTTAAVLGHDERVASVLPLDGDEADDAAVPSVLYLTGDDSVLVGRDALVRGESDPERLARNFVARVGDPIAPLLGGRPCPAEMLMAALAGWVVDRAVEAEETEPDRIVLTHPASWGPHRRAVLDQSLRDADLPNVLLLPKPVAAAENHHATHPIAEGQALAVYDLGETLLSCAVTRLGAAGFELLSRVETGEQVGGIHFDDALTAHVLDELTRPVAELDPFDTGLRRDLALLRESCRTAKETLSRAAETIIPTPRLGPPSSVLVRRDVLEELISPAVYRTVDTLRQAIRLSGQRVTTVALAGGSASIPLVADLIRTATGATTILDPEPSTAVARGAALAGRRVTVPVRVPEQRDEEQQDVAVDLDAPTQPPRPPVEVAPLDVPRRGARRWKVASRSRRRTG
jgi:molecular chaperone DnaK (HSP70)